MQTYTPAQWLLIDLATQYGKDKDVYKDRLSFGREILETFQQCDFTDMAAIKEQMQPYIDSADEPEMFCKSLIALSDVLRGKATGHLIGLDACNSGPQLLSVLCRCETGMKNTGAMPDLDSKGEPVRPDTYTAIYEAMETDIEVTRTQVKKVTVPYAYGADDAPNTVFGSEADKYLDAYKKALPWAYIIRQYALALWNPRADNHTWVMPDGFVAYNPVMDLDTYNSSYKGVGYTFLKSVQKPKKKGKGVKSLPANITHSYDAYVVREMQRRMNHDPQQLKDASLVIEMALLGDKGVASSIGLKRLELLYKKFGTISLEAVEYIEAGLLASADKDYLVQLNKLINHVLDKGCGYLRTIHDQFDCSPNNVQIMRETYNELLVEAAESDWLFETIITLGGKDLRDIRGELTPEMRNAILTNDYAIC